MAGPNTGGQLVRIAEAVRLLSISRSKLYKLMSTGELAYVKLGRSRRLAVDDLRRLIARNRVTG